MTKVKISKEVIKSISSMIRIENGKTYALVNLGYPNFEVEGEVVEEKQPCTHSQHPSGAMYCLRPDGCTYRVEEKCEHIHVYKNSFTGNACLDCNARLPWNLDPIIETKCKHPESMRKEMPFGRGAYCGYCGREFPQSPIIEELKDDFDTTSQVIKITDKLNEVIKALNLLRK